jgi:hypothetical protein
MELRTLLRPERAEGESFNAYKRRRATANYVSRIRTTLFWNSGIQGTYINHKKRAAKAARAARKAPKF